MADKKPLSEILAERLDNHLNAPAGERLWQGVLKLLIGLIILIVALAEVLIRAAARILEWVIKGTVSWSIFGIEICGSVVTEQWNKFVRALNER